QRRGLRIDRPAPDGQPRYVLDISPVTNTVTVGSAAHLEVTTVFTGPPTWSSRSATLPMSGLVQMRAHAEPVACVAEAYGEGLALRLDSAVRGIAPGQSAVLYDADRVVGSATIDATA